MTVQVVAHSGQEDLTGLGEIRLQKYTVAGVEDVRLESVRNVTVGGKGWVEARLLVTGQNGIRSREISRAFSHQQGTVVVIVYIEDMEKDSYDDVAEEILNSVVITE